MKKLILLCLSLLILLNLAAPLNSEAAAAKASALIDRNSHSFVPAGALKGFEGTQVAFEPGTKKISITNENTSLTMYLGQRTAYANGSKVSLKAAPFRDQGNVYVPLSFVGSELGIHFSFGSRNSTLTLKQGIETAVLPVQFDQFISTASKPITESRRTFKIGSKTISAQILTVSLLHPKVELDVAAARNKIGRVEDLSSIAKRHQAVAAINGTYFDAYSSNPYKTPYGYIFGGGKLLFKSSGDRKPVFTFDSNNLASIIPGLEFQEHYASSPVKGAVQVGPTLVVNGKVSLNIKNEGFKDPKILTGGGARSALGITEDHKLILLTTSGATIPQLAEMMKKAGTVQAMNLDGGASSGLYYNGAYLTSPGRQISNAIIIKVK